MNKYSYTYILIIGPTGQESQFFLDNFHCIVENICQITEFTHERVTFNINITNECPPKRLMNEWKKQRKTQIELDKYHWICIKMNNEENLDTLKNLLNNYVDVESVFPDIKEMHENILCHWYGTEIIHNIFRSLILVANICCPGVVICDRIIRTEWEWVTIDYSLLHYLDLINYRVEDFGWEQFEVLDVKDGLNWMDSIGFTFLKFSSNPILDAVHAFSQSFEDGGVDQGDSDIIWAMIGIESIFVDSHNVQKNIRDRIPTFLEISLSEKEINDLYSVRSRYIHGQVPIAHKWLNLARIIRKGRRKFNLAHVSDRAMYILIKALQKICKESIVDIKCSEETRIHIKRTSQKRAG